MKSYNYKDDIKTIRETLCYSQEEFAAKVGLSRSNIARYELGKIEPRKDAFEKIYSFAYKNNLYVNKAKEMLYMDENGDKLLLFHGAKDEIKSEIENSHTQGQKDFGAGFYLGESYDSAASWIADRNNGSCYCFYFDKSKDYRTLSFSVTRQWMYAILYFRGAFRNFVPTKEVLDIIESISNCDYLIAPIADNNMYETLNSFAYGDITDEQCLHALSANNLGLQYVFKSKRACEALECIDRLYLCNEEKQYYIEKKKEMGKHGRSKAELAINKYRRKGKYFDELFKRV